jgi:hypothetical protein
MKTRGSLQVRKVDPVPALTLARWMLSNTGSSYALAAELARGRRNAWDELTVSARPLIGGTAFHSRCDRE